MIAAVSVGVWALILLLGLTQGMIKSYISRSIENRTSHIQIHHSDWIRDNELEYSMDLQAVTAILDQDEAVARYSPRIVINGMIQSARSSHGVSMLGVIPEQENLVTRTTEKILEGRMLQQGDRNAILIGRAMAERLQLGLNNKVVISFQDVEGNISTAALKIVGIYSINDSQYEEQYAYLMQSFLRELAGLGENAIQEVAILLSDFNIVDDSRQRLSEAMPLLSVRDYGEISPEIELYNSSLSLHIGIMTTIVMLALIFGIINTMLMAILERERELGMLRAIGMGRPKVYGMVVMETIFLSLVGLPAGLVFGWVSIGLININGLDLSNWSAGLSEFGMSNIIFLDLHGGAYVFIVVSILATAILASLYPAWKAIAGKPLEALHRI
jgi:ABC-type lipoprotein release transport system permease subunit